MNFGDLKKAVAAYCRRNTGAFTVDSYDLLPLVCNQARKFAEKNVDFEFSKDRAKLLSVSLSTGASFSDIKDLAGTAMNVKAIQQAWTTDSSLGQKTALELMTRQAMQFRLQRRNQTALQQALNLQNQPLDVPAYPPTLVMHGTKLWLYPNDAQVYGASTQDVLLDVVKWLPDYSLDADTDFIMEHGSDWLIFNAMIRLNFFLKEDQRVSVEAAVVDNAWKSLIRWNQTLITQRTQEFNLD